MFLRSSRNTSHHHQLRSRSRSLSSHHFQVLSNFRRSNGCIRRRASHPCMSFFSGLTRICGTDTLSSANAASSPYLLLDSIQCDFFDNIASALDMPSLHNLKATSPSLAISVDRYLQRDYNRLLQSYGLDPLAFRALLRTTGCVIGGITALQFLLRLPTGSSSLDIFTTRHSVSTWTAFLQNSGYTQESTTKRPEMRFIGLYAVKSFTLKHDQQASPSRINVIVSSNPDSFFLPLSTPQPQPP